MRFVPAGQDFAGLVLAFRHTAFRLETREAYNEADEAPILRRFLTGGGLDESYMDDWIEMLTPRIADGQRMERVRVVSKPHSDYTRFGLALARYNVEAGEDIRYLPRHRAAELDLPGHDFWLIDSTTLLILRFGDDDVLLGADLVTDPAVVVKHCYYRDVAQHYAVPWQEYTKQDVHLRESP
ncbi:hypothetical protein OHA25_33400 [Nonomuraea sp. NBC_00507]|uniref:DUF6879 family protein n=1 Tax=Nonomuraea sp. NBC_00507 TaxID=2976002 RepID=UPI002E19A468|nr:DUF6879 family protein [Nonomuraea sp. NBC_00507]